MILELYVASRVRLSGLAARLSPERGASAVEYGLLVALIAGVIIAIVTVVGQKVSNVYSSTESLYP